MSKAFYYERYDPKEELPTSNLYILPAGSQKIGFIFSKPFGQEKVYRPLTNTDVMLQTADVLEQASKEKKQTIMIKDRSQNIFYTHIFQLPLMPSEANLLITGSKMIPRKATDPILQPALLNVPPLTITAYTRTKENTQKHKCLYAHGDPFVIYKTIPTQFDPELFFAASTPTFFVSTDTAEPQAIAQGIILNTENTKYTDISTKPNQDREAYRDLHGNIKKHKDLENTINNAFEQYVDLSA